MTKLTVNSSKIHWKQPVPCQYIYCGNYMSTTFFFSFLSTVFTCFQNPPNRKDAMDYSRIITGTAADCLLGDPPVTHGWLCTHPMQPGPAAAGGLQGGLILIYGVWSVKQCYTLDSNIRFYMECQIKTCLQSNHLQISRLMDLVYIYISLYLTTSQHLCHLCHTVRVVRWQLCPPSSTFGPEFPIWFDLTLRSPAGAQLSNH